MFARVEPLAVVIRVYPDSSDGRGQYSYVVTGVTVAPGKLKIVGALRAPTKREWCAVRFELMHWGYNHVLWERQHGRVHIWNLISGRKVPCSVN